MKIKSLLFSFFLLVSLHPASSAFAADTIESVKHIAVQHNGRVKSFDAFSRQTLRLITGKESWQRQAPAQTLWDMLVSDGSEVTSQEWIRLDFSELKTALNLPLERKYFSYDEIVPSMEKIMQWAQSAQSKRDRDVRPEKIEQKSQTLMSQLIAVQSLASKSGFALIPDKEPNGAWQPLVHSGLPGASELDKAVIAYKAKQTEETSSALNAWNASVATSHPNLSTLISLEVFYYKLHPFRAAWILYLLGFVLLCAPKGWMRSAGTTAFLIGFALHTAGLVLRVVVLQRPPVSNMYESMIFMNWALSLFAIIFTAIKKNTLPLKAAGIISTVIMIYADLLPLDPAMDVLVPVLRSNYWLTIHVLTVVSSYGAFGLAMAIAHRYLYLDALKKLDKPDAESTALFIQRVIEVGVILIGTGTVLGGVWANESWGRFWGWDPKETWALITLLGYLALIHLRYLGIIRDFGVALGAILGFLLVLFTWYGVNFVLGRGLHSYGQGSGGMAWVLYFLVFEALFLAFIAAKKFGR